MGDKSFFSSFIRAHPHRISQLSVRRLEPEYVFLDNNPANDIDFLGLHVYKVQLPSESIFPVDHRQVVGDDGKGGAYVLEFFAKSQRGCRCSGASLVGPGEISVQTIPKTSAADYIKQQGLKIVDSVDTSGTLVDRDLATLAEAFSNKNPPTYVFIFNDCGTIANSWLKNARDAVKNWQPPVNIPPIPFN